MIKFYLFVLILVIGMLFIKRKSLNDRRILVFAGVVITLFCGSVNGRLQGGDISNYYYHLLRCSDMSISSYLNASSFEKGYLVYSWVIVHAFGSPQLFMYVQYGIMTFTVLYFVYYFSDDYFIGVISYICIGGWIFFFTALRQGIACSLCLFSVVQIHKKRMLYSLIIILFATLFHKTAIVFFSVIIASKFKLSLKSIALFIAITSLAFYLLQEIVGYFNDIFDMNYRNVRESTVGVILSISLFIILFVMLYYYKIHNVERSFAEEKLRIIVYMSLISFVTYLMRVETQAVERVSFYFLPAVCPLWSYVLENEKSDRGIETYRILFCFFAIALLLFRFRHTIGVIHLIF